MIEKTTFSNQVFGNPKIQISFKVSTESFQKLEKTKHWRWVERYIDYLQGKEEK
jgi:type IV secretory pathway component VirB8